MKRIEKKVFISLSAEQVFDLFINSFHSWWPKKYTWSQDSLEKIYIDARENGLCTEIGLDGFRCDWGRITKLDKNKEIRMKWQISPNRVPVPNPDYASDIIIKFNEQGSQKTVLNFEHFNFENHGKDGERYREMMDSEQGWDYILDCFRKYCE